MTQHPLPGVSMRYTFDPADVPTKKETQYYEMFGMCGIWHQGWRSSPEQGPISRDRADFEKDRWQLFHTDEDRAEAARPRRPAPREGQGAEGDLWFIEAEANDVLPLDDLADHWQPQGLRDVRGDGVPHCRPAERSVHDYPGTRRRSRNVRLPTCTTVSYKALAEVDSRARPPKASSSPTASRFGGHALLIKDGQVTYVYNFLGIPPENRTPRRPGSRLGQAHHRRRVHEGADGRVPRGHPGHSKLYIDDRTGCRGTRSGPSMGHFSLCGEGLCIGYDSADAVSSLYAGSWFEFTGGEIKKVVFDVADDAYVDIEAPPRSGDGARLGGGCRHERVPYCSSSF